MSVLDLLKPQTVPADPPTGKPAPDKVAQAIAQANGLPLGLRRYDPSGVWQRPPRKHSRNGSDRGRAAAILRHYTGDGEEILVWMLLLARGEIGAPRRYVYEDGTSEVKFDGPPPDLPLMAEANRWCADRMFGKAPETVLQVTQNLDAQSIDLDKLSTEQLRALGEILRAPAGVPQFVEATPLELEP